MKIAIWTYTAAVGIASISTALAGWIIDNIFHSTRYHSIFGNKPLPGITQSVIDYHWGALAIPILWLIAAIILSRGIIATPNRCFAFAGISTLLITTLFCYLAIALLCPFVEIIVCMVK